MADDDMHMEVGAVVEVEVCLDGGREPEKRGKNGQQKLLFASSRKKTLHLTCTAVRTLARLKTKKIVPSNLLAKYQNIFTDSLKLKLSRGEICVVNFIPPENGASLGSFLCSKFRLG